MTRTLYHAFAARLATIAICGALLGGLAVNAAMSRPAEIGQRTQSTSCFDPATPEREWISCAAEVPR